MELPYWRKAHFILKIAEKFTKSCLQFRIIRRAIIAHYFMKLSNRTLNVRKVLIISAMNVRFMLTIPHRTKEISSWRIRRYLECAERAVHYLRWQLLLHFWHTETSSEKRGRSESQILLQLSNKKPPSVSLLRSLYSVSSK